MVPPSFEPENRLTLTSVPTHALPLTQAYGPDTPGISRFPFPSANHLPVNFPRVLSAPLLSLGVPSGLTFASKVSVFA